jgi:hypothetical protein
VSTVSSWRPDAVDSAALAAGIKAARELNAVPVPAWLSKQLSNYILRAEHELETRARVSPGREPRRSGARETPGR